MTESNLTTINYLTEAQYNKTKEEGNIKENELYITPDEDNNKKVRLYYNSAGTYESVPLSRSKSEFEILKIVFITNAGGWGIAEVPTDRASFALHFVDNNSSGTKAWLKKTNYTINDKELTRGSALGVNINNNSEYTDGNCIKVVEVIGISSSETTKQIETRPDIYSIGETIIGEHLGKTLYRKVITGIKSTGTYNHGINNFDYLVNIYGSVHKSNGASVPIPRYVFSSGSTYGINIGDVNSTRFYIEIGSSYNDLKEGYVVLEYTKTTD